jgi:hypothetical protein
MSSDLIPNHLIHSILSTIKEVGGLSCLTSILRIREGRGFNDLIEEALRDLLKKYREKSKGK